MKFSRNIFPLAPAAMSSMHSVAQLNSCIFFHHPSLSKNHFKKRVCLIPIKVYSTALNINIILATSLLCPWADFSESEMWRVNTCILYSILTAFLLYLYMKYIFCNTLFKVNLLLLSMLISYSHVPLLHIIKIMIIVAIKIKIGSKFLS